MEVKAADYVQYAVNDLETAISFYRDTLGLTLEHHIEEVGWAEFALPPTTLALTEVDAEDDGEPGDGSTGVAMAVGDVEAAVAELRDAGATIRQEPFETSVCDMARVADPDGNLVVLHRRHDGTSGRTDPFA